MRCSRSSARRPLISSFEKRFPTPRFLFLLRKRNELDTVSLLPSPKEKWFQTSVEKSGFCTPASCATVRRGGMKSRLPFRTRALVPRRPHFPYRSAGYAPYCVGVWPFARRGARGRKRAADAAFANGATAGEDAESSRNDRAERICTALRQRKKEVLNRRFKRRFGSFAAAGKGTRARRRETSK